MSEPEVYDFIKRETTTQVFSCEFWEIFKDTFLQNTFGGCYLKTEVYFSDYVFDQLKHI